MNDEVRRDVDVDDSHSHDTNISLNKSHERKRPVINFMKKFPESFEKQLVHNENFQGRTFPI